MNKRKLLIIILSVVICLLIAITAVVAVLTLKNADDPADPADETSSENESDNPADSGEESAPEKYSEGLAFTLNDDGSSYSVFGIGTCEDADIAIPPTYNKLPVTSIGNVAFRDCTSLEIVVFKNTNGWKVFESSDSESGVAVNVPDPSSAAKLLTDTYDSYYWRRG